MQKMIYGTFIAVLLLLTTQIQAKDLGFRYKNGKCVNAKGVEGYNPTFFGQCADFRGTILGRFDLDGIDFSGSVFTAADLRGSTLNEANLEGVSFDDANLSGVEMAGAIIKSTSFKNANLTKLFMPAAQFENISFKDAMLSGANLAGSEFKNCNLEKANLEGAVLEDSIFENTQLNGVIFKNANLKKVSLKAAEISDANLEKAVMNRVQLAGANLSGSKLTEALLNNANLSGANLSNVKMSRSNLIGADLSQAKVEKLDLTGSDLSSANLAGVKGSEISLVSVNAGGVVLTDAILTNSNFSTGQFQKAKIGKADFRMADLRRANFLETDLRRVNLDKAVFNKRTKLPITKDEGIKKGMTFKDTVAVFVLWDRNDDNVKTAFQQMAQLDDIEFEMSKVIEYEFDGTLDLKAYDVVLHLNGATYAQDLPEAGQKALVNFVINGGTYIGTEWNAFEITQNRMQLMKDLVLLQRVGSLNLNWVVENKHVNHPLVHKLGNNFRMPNTSGSGMNLVNFAQQPATVFLKTQANNNNVAGAYRYFGKGRAIHFAAAALYNNSNVLLDKNYQQLFVNAIMWGN